MSEIIKPQIQIDIEKRKKTHPCPKCGEANVDPETKFKFYEGMCKFCGTDIDCSYVFAPWGSTWEELQVICDKTKEFIKKVRK